LSLPAPAQPVINPRNIQSRWAMRRQIPRVRAAGRGLVPAPTVVPWAVDEMSDMPILVQSLKYNGRIHREWRARLVERDAALIVVEGVFAEEVKHPLLGTVARGTVSVEYYWTDRWYSVFRFRDPAGHLRNYYCNINRPAEFDGRVLTFVDLDIDVLVAPDFSFQVLDEDEFEAHAALYGYTREVREHVTRARAELIKLIVRREFPFDESLSGES
jgi:protein associated with RNAse G/E